MKLAVIAGFLVSIVTFSCVVSGIEAGVDAAVPDGPSVEQEGGREHDRGGHQGGADACEGTYSSDDGSSGQLPQRVRPVLIEMSVALTPGSSPRLIQVRYRG
jgi:hypothetical protein